MVEVLIVGAGPAGAVAAAVLARSGVRVLLVDRARFPRHKLCGDTVNPGTIALFRRLGLARPVERAGRPIEGMVVTGEHGVAIRERYGAGARGRSVMRRDLDAWLLEDAVAAGAHVEEGVAARAPIMANGASGVEVRGAELSVKGRRLRLPALVTIAADGRPSAFGRALGLVRHPRRPRRWAVGGYMEGVSGLTSFGEMHVRCGHYFGIAPLADRLANVCAVLEPRSGWRKPAALLAGILAADPVVRDRLCGATFVDEVTVVGPLAVDAAAGGMPGFLMAGDAAGFVDPMTGDGLRFAVRGGELAARAALEMLATGRRDGHLALAAWRRADFDGKLRFNRFLRRVSGSPAAVRLAGHTARVAPGLIRRAIRFAGDTA